MYCCLVINFKSLYHCVIGKGIILSTSTVITPKISKYTPPGGFCIERTMGNYADPMRCDGFIVCSKNEAVFVKCPENLLYNAATGWCDYATNVKCHGKKTYMKKVIENRKLSGYHYVWSRYKTNALAHFVKKKKAFTLCVKT